VTRKPSYLASTMEAAFSAFHAPQHTRSQRRRVAANLWRLMRRRRAGWESSEGAAKARVKYDSKAALAAMDARLARVGMQRVAR
jgi:hypothetical protein